MVLKVRFKAPQTIFSLQCRSEQPQVDSEEALKVQLKDEDILPSTSSELTAAPRFKSQGGLPPPPPAGLPCPAEDDF